MEISKATEAEVKQPTQRELEIAKFEAKEARKRVLAERVEAVKELKKDVEWLEVNYKYRQLRIALANQEPDYMKLLQREDEFMKQQQATRESMDNAEGPVVDSEMMDGQVPKEE
mgnify:CR=1 FL=1